MIQDTASIVWGKARKWWTLEDGAMTEPTPDTLTQRLDRLE